MSSLPPSYPTSFITHHHTRHHTSHLSSPIIAHHRSGMGGFGGSLGGSRDRDNTHSKGRSGGGGGGGGGGGVDRMDSASVSSQGSSSTTAMGIQLGGGMPRIKGGSNTPPRRGNHSGGQGGRGGAYGQSSSMPGPGIGTIITTSSDILTTKPPTLANNKTSNTC